MYKKTITKPLTIAFCTNSLIACSKKEEPQNLQPEQNCAAISCKSTTLSVKLQYRNKTTNEVYTFNKEAGYSINDIKVIKGTFRIDKPQISVDSAKEVITIIGIETGDAVQVGDLPADKFKITTRASSAVCCPDVSVTKLIMNGTTMCWPCNSLHSKVLELKKM